MGKRVEIRPSGEQFEIERGETVLEAALRSGVSVPYNCNNGTCGECMARVVEGEAVDALPHDYILKASEQARGMVLLCRAQAASDLVLEVSTADDAGDIPVQQIETSVHKLQRPRDDVVVLDLRTPRSNTLRFLAGQHAMLQIGNLPVRHKSIASCPCNGRYLQFHIRRVEGDPFTEYVFERLKPRDKVSVQGPFGEFTLDEESTRPIVFLAHEIGFAPIKSLIEHAIARELQQPLRLYWVGKHADDHYQTNYCRSWRDALDDFAFVTLSLSDAPDEAWLRALPELDELSGAERGLALGAARVVADHADLRGFDVYASGPRSRLRAPRQVLMRHGLPAERLFVDDLERV